MTYSVEITVRILIAMIIGGVVGLEREKNHHAAGLRTHMLVCVGSCVVMLIGLTFVKQGDFDVDPTRMAAQVISGIGFLGAGMILRDGRIIRGLTTAAGIWTIACIGLAVGAGFYQIAIIGASAIVISLSLADSFQKRLKSGKQARLYLEFTTSDAPAVLEELGRIMPQYYAEIKNINISEKGTDGLCKIDLCLFALKKGGGVKYSDIIIHMSKNSLIDKLSSEEF